MRLNLRGRVVQLERAVPPPKVNCLTPDQRARVEGMLANAWHRRCGSLFEHVVRTCRERGRVGEPDASWFQLA